MMDDVARNLIDVLGDPIYVPSSGELRWNCPFCITRRPDHKADSNFHLYVNPKRGKFICFRCADYGTKGPLEKLFKDLRVSIQPSLTNWQKVVQAFMEVTDKKPFAEAEEVPYPDGYKGLCYSAKVSDDVYNYLKRRGINDDDMSFHHLGAMVHYNRWRVFIPASNDKGKLVYYAARSIDGAEPKYLCPPVPRRAVVFNYVKARQFEDVVICEGPVSSIAAGPNAVATFGKEVTPEQVLMLVRGGWRKYFVAFDGEAMQTSCRLAERLHAYRLDVSIVPLPKDPKRKDPADLGRAVFINEFMPQAIPYRGEGKLLAALAAVRR